MEIASQLSRMHSAGAPGRIAGVAVALVVCAVLAAPAAASTGEVTRAPSGITYVTGGAGSDAVAALKAMEKKFDLKLVFTNKAGDYLSDVKVTIADTSGKVDLDIATDGPILMAKLPAGTYEVHATFGGKTQTRKLTISTARLESVSLQWAAS